MTLLFIALWKLHTAHAIMSPSVHCTIVSFNYFFTTVRQSVKVTWFNYLHFMKSAVNPNKVNCQPRSVWRSMQRLCKKRCALRFCTTASRRLMPTAFWSGILLLNEPRLFRSKKRESAVAADFNASEKAKSARADVEPQTLIHCPSAGWGIGAMKAADGVVKFVERLSEWKLAAVDYWKAVRNLLSNFEAQQLGVRGESCKKNECYAYPCPWSFPDGGHPLLK